MNGENKNALEGAMETKKEMMSGIGTGVVDLGTIDARPVFEKKTFGTVSNCKKLNVRSEAVKKTNNVLCIVSVGDRLSIDEKKSTNAWFYITTATGVSGYCMKEFVTVE